MNTHVINDFDVVLALLLESSFDLEFFRFFFASLVEFQIESTDFFQPPSVLFDKRTNVLRADGVVEALVVTCYVVSSNDQFQIEEFNFSPLSKPSIVPDHRSFVLSNNFANT